LNCWRFFLTKEKIAEGGNNAHQFRYFSLHEEDQKIRLAVDWLGLNSVSPFVPERIIEYIVAEKPAEPLVELTVPELTVPVVQILQFSFQHL